MGHQGRGDDLNIGVTYRRCVDHIHDYRVGLPGRENGTYKGIQMSHGVAYLRLQDSDAE